MPPCWSLSPPTPINASGTGENPDFLAAVKDAQAKLNVDVPKQKADWEDKNKCAVLSGNPKCSFGDYWFDDPPYTVTIDPNPAAPVVVKGKTVYKITLKVTFSVHLDCYKNEADKKAGQEAREAAALKAKEEKEKKKD